MNVIHTTPWLTRDSGGMPRSVTALSSALAGLGLNVDLFSLRLAQSREAHIFPASARVNTVLFPCIKFKNLRFFWAPQFTQALGRRTESARETIIHDHGLWQSVNHAAARIARRSRVPYIVSPCGNIAPWALRHRAWKKQIAWPLYARRDLQTARAFHATCTEEAEHLRQLGFRQPIAVIPHGVEVPEAMPVRPAHAAQKSALF